MVFYLLIFFFSLTMMNGVEQSQSQETRRDNWHSPVDEHGGHLHCSGS